MADVRVPVKLDADRAADSWIRTGTHSPKPTRFGWLVGKRIAQFSDGSCIFGWGFAPQVRTKPPRGVEWDEVEL